MEKFTALWPRNIRGERRMNSALALIGDRREATEFFGEVLVDDFGHLKSMNKHIAVVAKSNDRSSENWTQKRVLADVPHFLRCAQNSPRLNAAVIWLMVNGPAHPEAQKYLAEVVRFDAAQPEEGDRA